VDRGAGDGHAGSGRRGGRLRAAGEDAEPSGPGGRVSTAVPPVARLPGGICRRVWGGLYGVPSMISETIASPLTNARWAVSTLKMNAMMTEIARKRHMPARGVKPRQK